MSMIRIPNETEEQRAERIARQLQRARLWEDVLRALPCPEDEPEDEPATVLQDARQGEAGAPR